jgi:hypothetical protein
MGLYSGCNGKPQKVSEQGRNLHTIKDLAEHGRFEYNYSQEEGPERARLAYCWRQ